MLKRTLRYDKANLNMTLYKIHTWLYFTGFLKDYYENLLSIVHFKRLC